MFTKTISHDWKFRTWDTSDSRSGSEASAPLVEGQLHELVRNRRQRIQVLPTAAERFAKLRNVAMFCVAFRTMKRGFEAMESTQSSVAEGARFLFSRVQERI